MILGVCQKRKVRGGTSLWSQQLPEMKQNLASKRFLPFKYIMFISSLAPSPNVDDREVLSSEDVLLLHVTIFFTRQERR